MSRARVVALFVALATLVTAAPAWAQKGIAVGPGYLQDAPTDYFVLTGMGWFPVKGPNTAFTPLVFTPRVEKYFGQGMIQFDANMLWDIPIQGDRVTHPFIGMGFGVVHSSFGDTFSDTTPLLNVILGFRLKKKDSKLQFLVEGEYSAGHDYANTMVFNFCVLFPLGGK